MAEQRDMELTSSHKYITNTSTCGTVLTEYLPKACRRSHTNKAARKVTTYPGSPWEPPSPAERSTGTNREIQRLERRVWKLVCGPAGQRETSTDSPGHALAHPRPRHASTYVSSTWVLKLGFQGTDPGRGLGLAVQRQLKGTGVCGLGHNWGRIQDGVYVHHKSPIVNTQKEGHGYAIAASLSACSQQGVPPASTGSVNFVNMHSWRQG